MFTSVLAAELLLLQLFCKTEQIPSLWTVCGIGDRRWNKQDTDGHIVLTRTGQCFLDQWTANQLQKWNHMLDINTILWGGLILTVRQGEREREGVHMHTCDGGCNECQLPSQLSRISEDDKLAEEQFLWLVCWGKETCHAAKNKTASGLRFEFYKVNKWKMYTHSLQTQVMNN